jgi:response regulator RpfG family c-di-GMP phosphodiesterase
MSHVLLIEPDDDFCLFLWRAISTAGCRMTITGSIAEASEVLQGQDTVDLVVANAVLPDGSGLALTRGAAHMGKAAFVLRASRGRIEVRDQQHVVFRGDQVTVADFLERTIRRRGRTADASGGGGDAARYVPALSEVLPAID